MEQPGEPETEGTVLTTDVGPLRDPFAGIIGEDAAMQELFAMVRAVAAAPTTVLLEGESGTGKRLIAQAIHRADPIRREAPFVEISCGALPETLLESELFGHVRGSFTGAIRDKQGRFELADGGTVLLDEIDAFSPALQVKLLRAIEQKVFERVGDTRTIRVDVRLIAATNRSLAELVAQGRFREDLYYRLNVVALRLPPLRERPGDLARMLSVFLARRAAAVGKPMTGLTEEARARLLAYHWPGNVRELENAVDRAVILAEQPILQVADLPEEIRRGNGSAAGAGTSPPSETNGPGRATSLKEALRLPERELILRVLGEVRWNRSEAARRLGIHRSTLYHKMRDLGIEASRS